MAQEHRLPILEVRKIAKKLNLLLSSKAQREAVWERDKGVCAGCGEKVERFDADHIVALHAIPPSVDYPERLKYWAIANLQTMGVSCGCHLKKSRGEVIVNAKVKRIQKRLDAHQNPAPTTKAEQRKLLQSNYYARATVKKFVPRPVKQI